VFISMTNNSRAHRGARIEGAYEMNNIPVTPETLTRAQINALRIEASEAGDEQTVETCEEARDGVSLSREIVCEIINASS
jgi:hypothetical protein